MTATALEPTDEVAPLRTPSTAKLPRRSLLRPLGIVGYDALEPALLAALATEEPLLLVSDHGAAKTLLLLRLAESLGLTLRHYNASILQLDDLAGFPIPDERGTIRYAAPPGAIWDAEVAFFDEIGRCRPDVANKLFPIIHERRIQGVEIAKLRYRWAATNPPGSVHGDDSTYHYEGVEVLDPALADRFAWIVALPRYADLGDADRRAIISGVGAEPSADARRSVCELVAAAKALLPTVREVSGDALAVYVDVLISKLAAARIVIGGRRAATLFRNMIAIRAAHLALGLPGNERACRAALLSSIPDTVRRHIPRATLLTAHEAAWRETSLDDDDPRRTLLAVRDPLHRALLSLTLPRLTRLVRGEALAGALAELPPMEARMVAWTILPHIVDATLVTPTAIETVATLIEDIAFNGAAVSGYGPHREWAISVRTTLSKTALPGATAEFVHGVIAKHATPAAQLTGSALPNPADVIARLCDVRAACLAALGDIAPGATEVGV